MSDVAVRAEGLGKRYQISHELEPYGRLTETLSRSLRAPLSRIRRKHRDATEWFWALRDVSFELKHGDVVGIIGRNGAGKSTLLKILSRITEPTTGSADIDGRVASLLEVGTGFHPELTGRENIVLSGSILGMTRADTLRQFDEIVEFAGVERFLDTPVKRYSSGMQVRLGFAVAAHLEPEILFVDEVLAVGDAAFQAKCLGRLEAIGQSGRTVMFVSHSMPSILRLCQRALLLDRGGVVAHGPTHEVVRTYLESDLGRTSERRWDSPKEAPGDEVARLSSIRVVPAEGSSADEVDIRQPLAIEVRYWSEAPADRRPFANLHFFNDEGVCLFVSSDFNDRAWWSTPREAGLVTATCHIPGNFLAEGRVIVTAAVSSLDPTVVHAIERDAVAFQVVDRSEGDGVRGPYVNHLPGVVRPMLAWSASVSPIRE
jgi:lipopolysaccharide transport system ATP-binding protein